LHFSADVDDTGLVQASQLVLGQVRDIAGDFFRAQLGVTRNNDSSSMWIEV
jgi:hypothetical protein